MDTETAKQTATIDPLGRLQLPQAMRDALGLTPGSTVVVELSRRSISIEPPPRQATPITERIAKMELPVSSWEEMEQEIQRGRCH